MAPRTMSHGRTYPVAFDAAYEPMIGLPLDQLFSKRFGPFPPIVGTEQEGPGPWASAGQVRTIRTGDGGTMREELTSVDPPRQFTYDLRPLGGPMKPLIERVEGRWAFEPVGTGTRITWTWNVHPANRAAGLLLPAFAKAWQGYARRALDRMEPLLLAG